jgi:hypothetical protein
MGKVIKTLMAPDRTFYVEIVARDDGTFQYFGAEHDSYDGPGKYHPTGESGLYSTAEDTEAAAPRLIQTVTVPPFVPRHGYANCRS